MRPSKPGAPAGDLEMDDAGVRFSVPKLNWEAKWDDIIELGSQTHHLHPEKANFYICTRERCMAVPWDWKPLTEVKQLFRDIAAKAAGPHVILEDELGWAADLAGDFWQGEGLPDPATAALQAVWHGSVEKDLPLGGLIGWGRALTGAGAALLAAIALLALFLADSPAKVPVAFTLALTGSLALGVGAFLLLITRRLQRSRDANPTAIRFDGSGVAARFRSGEEKRIGWDRVRRCRMHIPSRGGLVLRLDDGMWSGDFEPAVAEAARRTCYAAKLAGK